MGQIVFSRFIYYLYAKIFGRKIFFQFNAILYNLGLRGLGILNYQNDTISGEKTFLKSIIRPQGTPVIIDVGANIGDYSRRILALNSDAQIFALEPHPVNFKQLQRLVKGRNVCTLQMGASNRNETIALYDYEKQNGSSHASLYREVIENLHHQKAVAQEVPLVRLDNFLEQQGILWVDLLKVDTEGHELAVLQGLSTYLEKNYEKIGIIHFEFNEMNLISKTTFKDFFEFLPNYSLFRLLPSGELLPLNEYSSLKMEIYAYQNIIAKLRSLTNLTNEESKKVQMGSGHD